MEFIGHRILKFGANTGDQIRLAGQTDLLLPPKLACAGRCGVAALLFEPLDLLRGSVDEKDVFAPRKMILDQGRGSGAGDAVVANDEVGGRTGGQGRTVPQAGILIGMFSRGAGRRLTPSSFLAWAISSGFASGR